MENPSTLLASVLSEGNVMLGLALRDRREIFGAVAGLWHDNSGLDEDEVVAGLNLREELGSTGLGKGLAIPHARVRGLAKPQAAFLRLSQAIEFGAPDQLPVDEFFVLVVPSDATEVHLEILAAVAEKMSGTGFRDELHAAASPAEVVRLFSA